MQPLCDPEVRDSDHTAFVDQKIRGLEIEMGDPEAVDVVERLTDSASNFQRPGPRAVIRSCAGLP